MVYYESKIDTSKVQFEDENLCSNFFDNAIPVIGFVLTLAIGTIIATMM